MSLPLKSNVHQLHEDSTMDQVESNDVQLNEFEDALEGFDEQQHNDEPAAESMALLAHITKQKPLPAGDVHRLVSQAHQNKTLVKNPPNKSKTQSAKKEIVIDGTKYIQANHHTITYKIDNAETSDHTPAALVDHGANGSMAGEDVKLLCKTSRYADVSGINNHTITGLPLATVAGLVQSQHGPVCVIMHQYAYQGKGKTIHSCVQIEHFGNEVNDKSSKVKDGKQCIVTLDGYILPLQFHGGLPYLEMRPPTDHELDSLPHVVLTSDNEWNPSCLDNEIHDLEEWFDAQEDLPEIEAYGNHPFDPMGNYQNCHVGTTNVTAQSLHHLFGPIRTDFTNVPVDQLQDELDCMDDAQMEVLDDLIDAIELKVQQQTVTAKEPDFEALCPLFAWAPTQVIRKTWDVTTRFGHYIDQIPFKQYFKSLFPAFNVPRCCEPVATDTVYSDTPAIDNGATSAQIFVGVDSLVLDVFGMKSDKQFVNTLEDVICKWGAMDKLISDRAQVEVSKKVLDILRNLFVQDWQSEPYHEHQNPAER